MEVYIIIGLLGYISGIITVLMILTRTGEAER
jgi:hypothetical protein